MLWSDFNEANLEEMLKSEFLSWPVTMAVLVFAFGALVAFEDRRLDAVEVVGEGPVKQRGRRAAHHALTPVFRGEVVADLGAAVLVFHAAEPDVT